MKLLNAVVAAVIIGAGPSMVQAQQPDPRPMVETVGTGERYIAPDRAGVMLFVESKAVSAAAAAAANARSVRAVRDTLARLGLDSAVATASYNVGPDYEQSPRAEGPRRIGYVARTVIRVQLRQLDLIGRVIDAALARGATGVENVWFESSTAEQARREAMADAAQAARRDAEALASSLGGTLGRLISVSTVGSMDPRRMNMALESAMKMGTQITPNEIVVRSAVETRWEFLPR